MDVRRIDSSDTNVSKYVFEFDNAVAEAVLYKYGSYEERTVICCSTQSGCPMGCRFCGAGNAFVRSLTADEIVSQVRFLFEDRKIDPKKVEKGQIMFMSMGEPLLNMDGLVPALRTLAEDYPGFALLISTSAPQVDYGPIRAISKEIPQIGLQFSVHESTDTARNKLIPIKGKLSLAEIAEEGLKWSLETGKQPFFNYCAHDENTDEADADRLRHLFIPSVWQATVSVICEPDESIAAANERQRALAQGFMNKLLDRGFSVRCFDPAGQDDIGGGCGQLWFVQDWMKNNPSLAKPSIGHGLPAVHAPVEEF